MEKKPKTKEVTRTIKEHTTTAVKDKAAQVGVKTKETVKGKIEEQIAPRQEKKAEQSPESYASDQVTETAEKTADEAVYGGEKAVKSTARHIKKKRAEKKANSSPDAEPAENPAPDSPEVEQDTNTPRQKSSEKSGENRKPSTAKQDTPKPDNLSAKESSSSSTESKPASRKTKSVTTEHQPASYENASASKEGKTVSGNRNTAAEKGKTTSANRSPAPQDSHTVPKDKAAAPQKTTDGPPSDRKTIRRKTPEQTAIKQRTRTEPKRPFETSASDREIAPRTKKKSPPKLRGQKTIRNVGQRPGEIRGAASTVHKAKEVEHSAVQTIKTADKSFKKAERTAKATKKAAEATAKAAKRSEEAARRTTKAAIRATRAAIKATIEGIKAAVAAAKELIAAAVAGSPAAIIIIIVICLIAAVGGTCFGIFLTNDETTGTQYTMTQAISQLTAEHYAELTDMKSRYTYDSMEIAGAESMSINWKDVLAVYAVKTTTSTENAYEVATMDDIKLGLLRDVISDMNQITCVVVPTVVSETVTETDERGNTVTTTKYVTKNILKVYVTRLTVDQIVEQYHFNDDQKKQLTELMSPDYDELWNGIIGATGDVLITNSTHIPTDIFAWPLQENWSITSSYGYRQDPKTGEWKFHGGTDIAAPTGTPILASADGTVVISDYMAGGYGYYVKIQHNDTFATLYGHCSVLHVTAGQQVKQGQVIADVGETGYATGPHVHFEVYVNGTRVDAMNYFR